MAVSLPPGPADQSLAGKKRKAPEKTHPKVSKLLEINRSGSNVFKANLGDSNTAARVLTPHVEPSKETIAYWSPLQGQTSRVFCVEPVQAGACAVRRDGPVPNVVHHEIKGIRVLPGTNPVYWNEADLELTTHPGTELPLVGLWVQADRRIPLIDGQTPDYLWGRGTEPESVQELELQHLSKTPQKLRICRAPGCNYDAFYTCLTCRSQSRPSDWCFHHKVPFQEHCRISSRLPQPLAQKSGNVPTQAISVVAQAISVVVCDCDEDSMKIMVSGLRGRGADVKPYGTLPLFNELKEFDGVFVRVDSATLETAKMIADKYTVPKEQQVVFYGPALQTLIAEGKHLWQKAQKAPGKSFRIYDTVFRQFRDQDNLDELLFGPTGKKGAVLFRHIGEERSFRRQSDPLLACRVYGDPNAESTVVIVAVNRELIDQESWQDVAARENVRLIDFDLTGHGCSPFEETATPRDLAERIIFTLKLLEVKSYHILGQGIAWDVVREVMSSEDTPRPTSCGFLDHTSADWLGVHDILKINEPQRWQFNACIQAIRRTRRTYFQGTERRSVLHSSCLKVEGGLTFSMWCQDGACDACVPDFALTDQYHADLRHYPWTPRQFAVMHHLVACQLQKQRSDRYIETELDALYKQFQTSTTLKDLVSKVEQRIQQELGEHPVVLRRLKPAVSLTQIVCDVLGRPAPEAAPLSEHGQGDGTVGVGNQQGDEQQGQEGQLKSKRKRRRKGDVASAGTACGEVVGGEGPPETAGQSSSLPFWELFLDQHRSSELSDLPLQDPFGNGCD